MFTFEIGSVHSKDISYIHQNTLDDSETSYTNGLIPRPSCATKLEFLVKRGLHSAFCILHMGIFRVSACFSNNSSNDYPKFLTYLINFNRSTF